MKIILHQESKEKRAYYREDVCILCGKNCNPHYRFFFNSKEKDCCGDSIIEDEISCCEECYPKIKKMFE